jgi:hypothetical protein
MAMSLTVELENVQVDRLQEEAARRGMTVSGLVASIVAEHVAALEPTAEEKKQRMLAALDTLDRLREDMQARVGPIDAEKLVREGREELERRGL